MIALKEVLDYLQPGPYIVSSDQYDDAYPTPVLTAGKSFLLGYTNEKTGIFSAKYSPVILFDDFTTASKWVDFDFKVKSSACKILLPKKGINLRYVFYAMQAIQFDSSEHRRYWIRDYSSIQIQYPSSKRQLDVVQILDGIQSQIEGCFAAMTFLDEQIKSLFNEMFSSDSMITLGSMASFFSGYAFKSQMFQSEGAPIIRISNIQNGFIDTSGLVFYPLEEMAGLSRFQALKGDILIAMSGATTGKVGLFDSDGVYYLNQRVGCIRPILSKTNGAFLHAFLNSDSMQEEVLRLSAGCAQPNISGKQILNLPIPDAPLARQKRFEQLIGPIDKLRFNYQRQIDLLNELMEKKMEEYFGGEEDA